MEQWNSILWIDGAPLGSVLYLTNSLVATINSFKQCSHFLSFPRREERQGEGAPLLIAEK